MSLGFQSIMNANAKVSSLLWRQLLLVWFCWTTVFASVPVVSSMSSMDSSIRSDSTSSAVSFTTHPLLPSTLARLLAVGDFEGFNQVLAQGVSLQLGDLPTLTVQVPLIFFSVDLNIDLTNVYCQDISIGDIALAYDTTTDTATTMDELTLLANVQPFSMSCYGDYSYNGAFSSSGKLTLNARNNQVKLGLGFQSPDFDLAPPNQTVVNSCTSSIDIYNIEFSRGVERLITRIFEQDVANLVENKAEEALCKDADKIFGFLDGLLETANEALEEFTQPFQPTDPLQDERNMETDGTMDTLIQLNGDGRGPISDILSDLIGQAEDILGDTVQAEDGTMDLAVNNWLRNNLLDEDGALSLDLNTTIYTGHDRFAKTNLQLQAIRVRGLDTFTSFQPIQTLGNFTLANQVAWKYLSVEADVRADISTSSLPDSLFVATTPLRSLDTLQLAVNVTDLDIGLAILVAANQLALEQTPLGGFLATKNLLKCVTAAMEDVGLSALNVSVSDISEPVIEGFDSPGFDRIISTLIKAVFVMYKSSLIRAIPSAMDSTIRKYINRQFLDPLQEDTCSVLNDSDSDFVDWRDFLVPPEQALELGGSGNEPMGNMAHWLRQVLLDRFVNVKDGDVLPGINSIVIRPLTKAVSGVEGALIFEDDLMDFAVDIGGMNLELTIAGVQLENLDTVQLPLRVLDPTREADVIDNLINMGMTNRPISLEMKLVIGLQGDSVPNGKSAYELAIRTTVDSIELAAEISAWVSSDAFLSFPLGDIMRPDCVLSILKANGEDGPLSFARFATLLSKLTLDIQCLECSGTAGDIIPTLVREFLQPGVPELLSERMSDVAASVASSSSMASLFQNLVEDAPMFCPSHSTYDPDASRAKLLEGVGFPELTQTGVDTLFYAGVVAGWSSLIVLADSQKDVAADKTDALSAQDSFVVPPGARLVDWTDLGSSTGLGDVVDDAFDLINDFLTSEEDGDLGINSLFRDVLGDSSTLEIPTESLAFDLEGFAIGIDRIRVGGLDSFKNFGGLQALGAQTLGFDMEMATLDLEIDITAAYETSDESPQTMSLRFAVENATFSFALFAALDVDMLGDLTMGSLLDSKNIIPCILSSSHSVQIPSIELSFDGFKGPDVQGLLARTSESASNFLSITSDIYESTIIESFPKLVEGPIRSLLAAYLDDSTSAESTCSRMRADDSTSVIDFRDLLLTRSESLDLGGAGDGRYGDIVPLVMRLLRNELSTVSSSGLSSINGFLVDPLTRAQSGVAGTLRMGDDLVDERLSFAILEARFRLRISDAYVENLNTIGAPFSLLDVDEEPYVLRNAATIGVRNPVRMGAKLLFSVGSKASEIKNEVYVELQVEELNLVLDLLLKLLEEAIFAFPIRDITNINCLLAALPTPTLDEKGVRTKESEIPFDIKNLAASFDDLIMNVSCVKCSSPGFSDLSELLSTPGGKQSASNFAEGAFDIIADLLGGDFLTLQLDRMIADARARCPHRPEFDPNAAAREFEPFDAIKRDESLRFIIALAVAVGCTMVGLAIVLMGIKVIVRRRHRKWIDTLSHNHLAMLWKHQENGRELDEKINMSTHSLFRSGDIPFFVRLLVPIVIVGNIGLFLSGHLSPAASVNAIITVAGDSYQEANLFEFSLANGTINVWNAGGKELAILIFVFSGVWPYTKQLLSLALWFLPPQRVSCATRENVYLWLDFLAKWSMVDVFTILISLVAFRLTIESPSLGFLPEEFYRVDLLVIPKLGLYANLTAQVVSQISSHFIIHYTRNVTRLARRRLTNPIDTELSSSLEPLGPDTAKVGKEDPVEESLAGHAYRRAHRGENELLGPRPFVGPLVCFCAMTLAIFVVLGCSLPSFSAETFGILGIAIEAGSEFKEEAVNEYTLFSMVTILFEQAQFRGVLSDFIGLGFLGALLISTVLVVPIMQASLLVYHWFFPMRRSRRKRLIVLIEILQAWQYTEVYALSVVAGAWQLGSVSHFMINVFCQRVEEIRNLFAQLVYFDVLEEEDAQCFIVEASACSGFFLLAAGSILLALLNTFVSNAAKQFLSTTPDSTVDTKPPPNVRDIIEPSPMMFTDRFRWLLGSRASSKTSCTGEDFPQEGFVVEDIEKTDSDENIVRASTSSSDGDESNQSSCFMQAFSSEDRMEEDVVVSATSTAEFSNEGFSTPIADAAGDNDSDDSHEFITPSCSREDCSEKVSTVLAEERMHDERNLSPTHEAGAVDKSELDGPMSSCAADNHLEAERGLPSVLSADFERTHDYEETDVATSTTW